MNPQRWRRDALLRSAMKSAAGQRLAGRNDARRREESQASPRRAAQGKVQFLIVELESDGGAAMRMAGLSGALR